MATIEVTAKRPACQRRSHAAALDQHHPDAADGVQQPRLGGGLAELAPQQRDVRVEGLVRADVRLPPDGHEQLGPGHDPAGALGEIAQHVELLARQPQRLPVEAGGAGAGVDAQRTHLQRRRRSRLDRPATAQDGGHPGQHVGGRERLGHVVVRAGVEQPDRLVLAAAGGGDDDRHGADRPDHHQRVGAVHVGQSQVEDDHGGLLRGDRAQRVEGGVDRAHGIAGVGERPRQRAADGRIVLDEQDQGHGGTVPRLTRCSR